MTLIGQFNRSGDGSMVVPSEYLEIVDHPALKRAASAFRQ